MSRLNWKQMAFGSVFAVACMIVGASVSTTKQAHGEVTGTPEPPTFQAGSVPVLREIAATLRQMDARLARLEVTAQKMQATAAARNAVAQPPNITGAKN